VSTAKHELQAQLERVAAIEAIAIEVKAIGYNEDNDDTSSNDDPAQPAHDEQRPASEQAVGQF
jgi:hypothetical protein